MIDLKSRKTIYEQVVDNFKELTDPAYFSYLVRSLKLAVLATPENINTMKQQEKAKKAQEAAEKAEAQAISKKLEEITVKIVAKAGEGGRLFGAVTGKEIAEALSKQHGITINKAKLVLDEPIKACGGYKIKAKLGHEIVGTVNVMVAEA